MTKATRLLSDAHRARAAELKALREAEALGLPAPETPHLDSTARAIGAHHSGLPNRSATGSNWNSSVGNPLLADCARRETEAKRDAEGSTGESLLNPLLMDAEKRRIAAKEKE